MANPERKHPDNVPGNWFVDDSCIDCDASRQCAPDIFGHVGGQSVVIRQPETADEVQRAARALLVCPTASIGVLGGVPGGAAGGKPQFDGLFPLEIEDGVFLCGFNSPRSYGANSFLIQRPGGNFLVDAPRFVRRLLHRLEDLGGVADILLTHRDDVADARQYAEHFDARVWIHEDDRDAAPFATEILRGRERQRVRGDMVAIPAPGHTLGSVIYHLEDRYLLTGDSLYWSRSLGDLSAFHGACWYSWEEQTRSLESLLDLRFEWVLAGHGDRRRGTPEAMHASLARLVERMKSHDPVLESDYLW
ncbi:MAG TPA: MBL fold metallo-hydrolase [Haliangium sp.]|nr:MBL fold metallo-hydrolase [Haliangium sp.]